jgi:hypothetical protein
MIIEEGGIKLPTNGMPGYVYINKAQPTVAGL